MLCCSFPAIPFLLHVVALGATAMDPFPLNAGEGWQWVPIVGSKCMDGKETGIYIRYSSSRNKNVAVHLDGGGACFNVLSCQVVAHDAHPIAPENTGIFANDTRNPLKDYNWIHVPYCTGDVHLGHASVQFELSHRHFHGRVNLGLIMERAFATFPIVDNLYITGESGGGFGALGNYDFLRGHWTAANGNSNMHSVMVDDSGPILDDEALPVCLQEIWRKTWNINASLPVECPCIDTGGNLVSAWKYQMNMYPNDRFGLISSVQDQVISAFLAFGELDCWDPIPIGYTKLEAGLKRLSQSGVPVYMIPGNAHIHASYDEFYTRSVNNTLLYKWVEQLMGKGPIPGSVSPPTEEFVVV